MHKSQESAAPTFFMPFRRTLSFGTSDHDRYKNIVIYFRNNFIIKTILIFHKKKLKHIICTMNFIRILTNSDEAS